jgi:hypothetical protein
VSEEIAAEKSVDTELRIVVDAQLVLAMFLARRDRLEWQSPKRQLLKLFTVSSFNWLWSTDIITDYERGARAVQSDERIIRRAVFDRLDLNYFLEP